MNRSTRVCWQIMRFLVKNNFATLVDVRMVEKAIISVRGPDKRTITNWKLALETLGFLERKTPKLYEMHLEKCPELLVEVVKQDERQKRLM